MAEPTAADIAMDFEWVAAPSDLTPYVNSLYVLRAGDTDIADMMPAYSAQLVVRLRGASLMQFATGVTAQAPEAFFLAPMTQAQGFTLDAHSVMIGISLNVRGWAALTGLAADKTKDQHLPAGDVLAPDVAQRLASLPQRVASGELTEQAALDEMADAVRGQFRPLSERHEQVIDRTLVWLSASFKPEIADLMDALPYSERQVQRLVARFFAQTPVRLVRRFRAIRAATLFAMEGLDPKLEAEVRDSFYDQAHMIKEIRFFTGRTPRRLQPQIDSVVRETLGEPGYGSVDLFGGNAVDGGDESPR